VDLGLFDGQSFELGVVLSRLVGFSDGCFSTLSSSGAIAVRKVRYRRNALLLIFDPLFRAHRFEQAQVIALDCKSAASRLEITSWAMLVQDQRRCFVGEAGRRDFLDDLSGFWEVVGDLDDLIRWPSP
jgi:hypothetical protein